MELKDLSSNWKKLQATLQNDTVRPPKRKASKDALQPHSNGVKRARTRLESTPRDTSSGRIIGKEQKLRNMGLGASRESEKSALPSASLALWAEDNDISAKDLALAYGTSVKTTSIPSVPDTILESATINEGLSSTTKRVST